MTCSGAPAQNLLSSRLKTVKQAGGLHNRSTACRYSEIFWKNAEEGLLHHWGKPSSHQVFITIWLEIRGSPIVLRRRWTQNFQRRFIGLQMAQTWYRYARTIRTQIFRQWNLLSQNPDSVDLAQIKRYLMSPLICKEALQFTKSTMVRTSDNVILHCFLYAT